MYQNRAGLGVLGSAAKSLNGLQALWGFAEIQDMMSSALFFCAFVGTWSFSARST